MDRVGTRRPDPERRATGHERAAHRRMEELGRLIGHRLILVGNRRLNNEPGTFVRQSSYGRSLDTYFRRTAGG
jgi:hypothetical protein